MESSSTFKQTPLFQLNLLLWLVWPATYAGITPLFRNEGFELLGIGPELSLDPSVRMKLSSAEFQFQDTVHPDLVLKHTEGCVCIPIECKLNSFSANSNKAVRQANTLLSINGKRLADWIGLPSPTNWTSFLIYAVEGGKHGSMLETLESLSTNLNQVIEPNLYSSLGIRVQDDGIYLEGSSSLPIAALAAAPNLVQVRVTNPGDDPRPLYLIPLDPTIDTKDEYEKQILQERIRLAVVSSIGRLLNQKDFSIQFNDILPSIVDAWDYWKDVAARKALRDIVRQYIKSIVREMRKQGISVTTTKSEVRFSDMNPELRQKLRRYLTSRTFLSGDITLRIDQLSFDELGDSSDGGLL